ncbi:hypothetical protein HPP92_012432 [Vanilla planifolia]|uniref:Uncharacterized protein n=1 Tax=Vanilla planifolia TaxID=51239 RepID=A0A835UXS1_VANPL|nr:hypothetical protein HPP92_012432 [Vanilla planifolia]
MGALLPPSTLVPFIFFLLLSPSLSQLLPINTERHLQTYIIHVKHPNSTLLSPSGLRNWHASFLPNGTLSSGSPRLIYSYRSAISGFAARLTPEEARAMEEAAVGAGGFLLCHPDRSLVPHTTYTPRFLGLADEWASGSGIGAWEKSFFGEGVAIGLIDSGGQKDSLFDGDGHGTHVAGIAAGNFVLRAEVGGMASGTASGMAPKAHLAVYKACFEGECRESDILAAVEQGIHDGVDVFLLPLGGLPQPMYRDAIATASFSAFSKGIIVCTSAGNSGPRRGALSHEAPWLLTVGASNLDRRMKAAVKLGNGVLLVGESAFQPQIHEFPPIFLPLVFPGIDGDPALANCRHRSLRDLDLRGKIILCFAGDGENTDKTRSARAAGAAGVILMNRRKHGSTTRSEMHDLPASHVSYFDGRTIRSYIYSSPPETATAALFFNGTAYGARPSPAIAAFSARGPSMMNGGLLKPDIVAPGVNVLSAWPPHVNDAPSFGFLSGTSMAAAHVAGVAALVRRRHRRWSPAMIHSALVTSAIYTDLDGFQLFDELSHNSSASLFATGAGQLNPEGAMRPGLVYDINPNDYLHYLCGLGYTNTQIWVFAKRFISCNESNKAEQLNYPTISARLGSNTSKIVRRTATSVRKGSTVYWARIEEPSGVRVDLSRYQLSFSRPRQEESYEVRLSIHGRRPNRGHVSQGRLSWVSKKHVVSSPILVTFD